MPGWLKALLITALVVVLLLVGAVGAGIVWWMRNKDSIQAEARETANEGRAFGEKSDNQACVDEGFARYKKAPGFFNSMNYSSFIEGCLEVSRPTPAFCDDVPVGKIMELSEWRASRCRQYGLPNDQKCGNLIMPHLMFCTKKLKQIGEG